MNISKITILIEDGPILAVLIESKEIICVFSSYSTIAPDMVFTLKNSLYVTENIGLKLVDNTCFEVDIFVKFLQKIEE